MEWYEIAIPIYFGLAGGFSSYFRIGKRYCPRASSRIADCIIGIPAFAVWPIVLLIAWLTGNLYTIKGKRV